MNRHPLCPYNFAHRGTRLVVYSRYLLDRIENESFGLRSPAFANVFEGRKALQSLEPTSEVIGCDEVREMPSKLSMALSTDVAP
jgi:hypothetical protein